MLAGEMALRIRTALVSAFAASIAWALCQQPLSGQEIPASSVEGRYELCRELALFETETLTLRDGAFEHERRSDAGGRMSGSGTYELSGSQVVLRPTRTTRAFWYEHVTYRWELVDSMPVLRRIRSEHQAAGQTPRDVSNTLVHESVFGGAADRPVWFCRELGVVDPEPDGPLNSRDILYRASWGHGLQF
jgi:hypothetical protein